MSSIQTTDCEVPQATDVGFSATNEHSNFQGIAAIRLRENDPLHPYNLVLVRKWLAVATLSTGSLCV
jgi:hypothetical protein